MTLMRAIKLLKAFAWMALLGILVLLAAPILANHKGEPPKGDPS